MNITSSLLTSMRNVLVLGLALAALLSGAPATFAGSIDDTTDALLKSADIALADRTFRRWDTHDAAQTSDGLLIGWDFENEFDFITLSVTIYVEEDAAALADRLARLKSYCSDCAQLETTYRGLPAIDITYPAMSDYWRSTAVVLSDRIVDMEIMFDVIADSNTHPISQGDIVFDAALEHILTPLIVADQQNP